MTIVKTCKARFRYTFFWHNNHSRWVWRTHPLAECYTYTIFFFSHHFRRSFSPIAQHNLWIFRNSNSTSVRIMSTFAILRPTTRYDSDIDTMRGGYRYIDPSLATTDEGNWRGIFLAASLTCTYLAGRASSSNNSGHHRRHRRSLSPYFSMLLTATNL